MNIIAPVDSAKEAKLLIKMGVDELFCGYIPDEWVNKYAVLDGQHVQTKKKAELITVSLNKRNNIEGNVRTREEMIGITNAAKEKDKKVFVTLNAFYYVEEEYEYLEKYIKDLLEIGVSGFIVTDVALIYFMKQRFPKAYVILSCCNQVANSWSVKFFKSLGVKRITFPRHVTVDEIIDITQQVTDIDYECFVLDSRCIYDDGNCRAMHNFGHFCMEKWDYEYYEKNKEDCIDYHEIQKIKKNEMDFIQWTKPYLASNATNNGWFSISCAACAVPFLMKNSGVSTLKIAGRGMDTNSKIMMVRAVKKMISIASKNEDNAVSKEREYICKLVGVPEMCELQSRCLMPSKKYEGDVIKG